MRDNSQIQPEIKTRINTILSLELNSEKWIKSVLSLQEENKDHLRQCLGECTNNQKNLGTFQHLVCQLGFTAFSENKEIIEYKSSVQQKSKRHKKKKKHTQSIPAQPPFTDADLQKASKSPDYMLRLIEKHTGCDLEADDLDFQIEANTVFLAKIPAKSNANLKSLFLYKKEVTEILSFRMRLFPFNIWDDRPQSGHRTFRTLIDLPLPKLPNGLHDADKQYKRLLIFSFQEYCRAEYALFVEHNLPKATALFEKMMNKSDSCFHTAAFLRYIDLLSTAYDAVDPSSSLNKSHEYANPAKAFEMLQKAKFKHDFFESYKNYRLGMFYSGTYKKEFKNLIEMQKSMIKQTADNIIYDYRVIAYCRLGELYQGFYGNEIFEGKPPEDFIDKAQAYYQKAFEQKNVGEEQFLKLPELRLNMISLQKGKNPTNALKFLVKKQRWSLVCDYYSGHFFPEHKDSKLAQIFLVSSALDGCESQQLILANQYYRSGHMHDCLMMLESCDQLSYIKFLFQATVFSTPNQDTFNLKKATECYQKLFDNGYIFTVFNKLLQLSCKPHGREHHHIFLPLLEKCAEKLAVKEKISDLINTKPQAKSSQNSEAPQPAHSITSALTKAPCDHEEPELDEESLQQETVKEIIEDALTETHTPKQSESSVFVDEKLHSLLYALKYENTLTFLEVIKLTKLLGGTVDEKSKTITIPGASNTFTYHVTHQKNQYRRKIQFPRTYWSKWKQMVKDVTMPDGVWDII